MKNNRLNPLPIILTALLLVFASVSFAADEEPKTYGEQVGLKATTSLANLTTSWLEIPKNIINVTNAKDSNIFYGFVGGTFKGAIVMLGRMGTGVADLITIPLPTKPIASPLYIWDDFDVDTSFGPVFRLYDKQSAAIEDEGDDDGDGVVNSQDMSPNTPKGANVDEQGFWAYHGVFFDFDKDELKVEFMPLFDNAIEVLNQNPGLTVEIQGHTDNVGDVDYNIKLSERRAQAVKDYLVSHGIDASRLTVKGFGMSLPAQSNDTEEGRAYNRRVNFERTDILVE